MKSIKKSSQKMKKSENFSIFLKKSKNLDFENFENFEKFRKNRKFRKFRKTLISFKGIFRKKSKIFKISKNPKNFPSEKNKNIFESFQKF